jgi:hypothetical protein
VARAARTGVAGFLIALACAASAASAEVGAAEPTRIVLASELRFATPDGDTAGVAAGAWRVEAVADAALRLVPEEGASVVVLAREAPHAETLAGPLAITSEGEGGVRVLLLFPDGSGLEAIGRSGGVATRGEAPAEPPLPPRR